MKKVMVFGTFDGIHPGHLNFFKQAQFFGDHLIIVVARDKNVSKIKGRLPNINERKRLSNLIKIIKKNKLHSVKARLGQIKNPYQVIKIEKPEVICLGYDQKSFEANLKEIFPKVIIQRLKGYKTKSYKSSIINRKIMKGKFLSLLIIGLFILTGCAVASKVQTQTKAGSININLPLNNNQNASAKSAEVKPQSIMPENIIDQTKAYAVILKTEAGDIEISLNAKDTPITANNFLWLAQKGFYDNTIFHRAIKGFMIQGGDPKGDGSGGPGYQFADEKFSGEYSRGTVAMANAGPNTNGSQFFIMHSDYPLPKNYVIFGKVIKGLEVVDKIATAPVVASAMGEMSKPVVPIKILSTEIIAK